MAITNGWFDAVPHRCSNDPEFICTPQDEKASTIIRWLESNTFRENRKETNEMPYRKYSECSRNPGIKKVIFNPPATIVFWYDNIKTVVKCGENETFDPEKGLAMAIAKRYLQNKGNYYNTFKKWLPEEPKKDFLNKSVCMDIESRYNCSRTCTLCKYLDNPPHFPPCDGCYQTISKPNFVKETE